MALAFALHLVWELAQLPLYAFPRDTSIIRIAGYVLHCTGGDVLIATATFLLSAAVLRRIEWTAHAPWRGGAIMIVAGLAYTAFSEWYNVYRAGSWVYGVSMALVAGIGLAPLLQWLIVPFAMLLIARGLLAAPRMRERFGAGAVLQTARRIE